MTANSTEADTELGAWRQPESRGGGGCWGRFVRREEGGGRKKSGGIDGWRDRRVGREDGERFNVMKQETGRGAERKKPIWGRWDTNAEFSLI